MVINILKQITKLQDIIKTDDLYYESKSGQIYNFTEYILPIVFQEIYMKGKYH